MRKANAFPFLQEVLGRRLLLLGVLPDQVVEKFVRGSGPGGQKINKTSSTVWLRHLPTGLEVRSQRERSQSANRAEAWTELVLKLEDRRDRAASALRSEKEAARRRNRPRTTSQKKRMVDTKRQSALKRRHRGEVNAE